MVVKVFSVTAIVMQDDLDSLFGDLVDVLIIKKAAVEVLTPEIERLLSTLCQKNNLKIETINRIKSAYGESYFSLMDFNYSEYLASTFNHEGQAIGNRNLKEWLKIENLQTAVMPLPLFPDFSNDFVIVNFGDDLGFK